MRVLLQRVARAEVRIREASSASRVSGRIDHGYVLLVGFTATDGDEQVAWMAEKVVGLRLFSDAEDKMNLALADVGGAVLVVSQFTLYGDARKGRRPSFIDAARPETCDPAVRAVRAATAGRRSARRNGRVRRDDGRRARERRSGDAVARAMSAPARDPRLAVAAAARAADADRHSARRRAGGHRRDARSTVSLRAAHAERLAREKATAIAAREAGCARDRRRHDRRRRRRHPRQAEG